MTSKLTFRARTLDASRPMAIFNVEDLPELTDLNAINRSVPAMPSGMEKEEESEKHLQVHTVKNSLPGIFQWDHSYTFVNKCFTEIIYF